MFRFTTIFYYYHKGIVVEPLNENSLQVSWSAPSRLPDKVRSYSINCSVLHSFDDGAVPNITSEVSVTVSSDLDSAVIHNLKPYTMYSITMTANNNYGTSLQSDRVRALTLDSGVGTKTSVAVVPVLPGISRVHSPNISSILMVHFFFGILPRCSRLLYSKRHDTS